MLEEDGCRECAPLLIIRRRLVIEIHAALNVASRPRCYAVRPAFLIGVVLSGPFLVLALLGLPLLIFGTAG